MFNPAFHLIEDGKVFALGDIPARGGVIDVAKAGTAGVIGALKAGHGWLVRDAVSPAGDGPGIHLQTSGTTGAPKWAATTLERLAGGLKPGDATARWLLTFNPGSFAGVNVILSAMMGPHVLIAPPYGASVADMANLAVQHQVTHISGTPTFWRAFLMVLGDRALNLKAVTLGGEASDQAILNALKIRFPHAALRHIYATTEAGRVLTVSDGKAGFPRSLLTDRLTISERGTLTVGGLDTGDAVEIDGDRVLFRGRIDAMVNVGGVKVYPEQVEAHLLQLPCVQDVRVSARPNPITGQMLVADIVSQPFSAQVEAEVKVHLAALPRSHRPAVVRYVEALAVGATGKKLRSAGE